MWYHARSRTISAGQKSRTVANRTLPCADRSWSSIWYHTWNSVLLAANLEDGSFFFVQGSRSCTWNWIRESLVWTVIDYLVTNTYSGNHLRTLPWSWQVLNEKKGLCPVRPYSKPKMLFQTFRVNVALPQRPFSSLYTTALQLLILVPRQTFSLSSCQLFWLTVPRCGLGDSLLTGLFGWCQDRALMRTAECVWRPLPSTAETAGSCLGEPGWIQWLPGWQIESRGKGGACVSSNSNPLNWLLFLYLAKDDLGMIIKIV